MSYDIFVQDLPREVNDVDEIPDDFTPGSLGPRSRIVEAIRRAVPSVSIDDSHWATIQGPDYVIEINLGDRDPVDGFACHVYGGGDAALRIVSRILHDLGMRALAPESDGGIFPPPSDNRRDAQRS
jgi:hypothetical protein